MYLKPGDQVTSCDNGAKNVHHWAVLGVETEINLQTVTASAPGQGSVRFTWTPHIAAGHGHGLLFKVKEND